MFTDHRCSTHQPCLYSTRQSLVFVRSFISPVHHILWPPFQHSVRLRPSSPTFPSSPIDIPAFVLISIIDLLQMDRLQRISDRTSDDILFLTEQRGSYRVRAQRDHAGGAQILEIMWRQFSVGWPKAMSVIIK